MGSMTTEENELLSDSKYRGYMNQIDRCLRGFESTSEWADLIAALSKLNKVLLAHMKYPIIPRRILISKRLAQCMHPALPAGVHQKALETYDIIFKCMGTNRLAMELFIYSAGLFPLLCNAALNVRSILLSIYETHFVPLGARLRPALNGFLSGVLPGLEEGSEHYQKTNNLLESVAEAVDPQVFYSALWECVATNSTVRLPALTFVLAHCGKKSRAGGGLSSLAPHMLGADHDVMCRAICLALQDSSVLVQRSALDLLLQGFPLHQPQFVWDDMVCLMASVLKSLLRRDMSLNRRLFNWLHGLEVCPPKSGAGGEDGGEQESYFGQHGKELVVLALRRIMEDTISYRMDAEETAFDTKPYRILSALLDKPEVGPLIIQNIMIDIFRLLYLMSGKTDTHQEHGSSQSPAVPQELIKTANLLFSQLETGYVWSACEHHFGGACAASADASATFLLDRSLSADIASSPVRCIGTAGTDMKEMCALIHMLLSIVSIETYAEASLEHLPRLFQSMVTSIARDMPSLTGADMEHALRAVKRVLERIMSAVNVWEGGGGRSVEELDASLEEPLEATEFLPRLAGHQSSGDNRTRNNPRGLISGCVPAYTDMFLSLVRQRILETPSDRWHTILTARLHHGSSADTAVLSSQPEGETSLTGILNRFMQGKDFTSNGRFCAKTVERARLRDVDPDFVEAFNVACTGLLELSSMPKLGGDEAVKLRQQGQAAVPGLPAWLQAILMCATVRLRHQGRGQYQEGGLKIQLSAISTLLDLAHLTATCQASGIDRSGDQHTVSVTVPVYPLIREQHLRVVTEETDVVCHVAHSLWTYLDTAPTNFHPQCIPLLHRLLELAPDAGSVEKVLAGSLAAPSSLETTSSVDASVSVYKRFAQFWHLSRDLSTPRQRTMDLCLLKMMSGLCARASSVRVVCEVWVEHALMRGDTGRLLETLLLALLDPSTARLSVLHWSSKENNNSVPSKSIKVNTYIEEELAGGAGFPFAVLGEGLINPFALVNSESEFNSDPSGDPAGFQSLRLTPLTRSESGSSLYQSNLGPSGHEESSTCSSLDSTVRKRHSSCLVPGHLTSEDHEATNIVADLLDAIMHRVVAQDTYFLRLDDISFPSARDSSSDGLERDEVEYEGSLHHGAGEEEEVEKKMERPLSSQGDKGESVHPLHSHLLLYSSPIDSRSLLHFIKALSNILSIQPRLAVSSLASTGVASPSLTRCVQLIQLLARHKRSILGKGFSASVSAESVAGFRSAMLLEVVLTINLYFVRSFYPRIPGLSREEILGNRELQLAAAHLINQIITELILLVNESGKPFALFLVDIFRRIKLQKVILHTVLSLVHSVPKQNLVTTQILRLNMGATDMCGTSSLNSDAFQVQLLKLVVSLVMLEEVVFQKKYEDAERPGDPPAVCTVMKYHPEFSFAEQPMLLAAVLSALRQPQLRELHAQWTNLVISCLPFFGASLTRVVTSVCGQIWGNLEIIAQQAMQARSADPGDQSADASADQDVTSEQNECEGEQNLPALSDYVLMQLEALGHILSYCLLDTGQAGGLLTPTTQSSIHSTVASFVQGLDASKTRKPAANKDHVAAARQSLLSMTPRLVVALTALWNAAATSTRSHSSAEAVVWLAGTRGKAVKSMILELLSPLAKVHPTHFLAAVSIARWEQTESGGGIAGGVTLVQLVSSLKMFPTTTVINTLRQVVRSPPPVSGSMGSRLEVYTMEFLSAYLSSLNSSVLAEAWPSLKDLLKDCLSLKPASVFLALEILHQSITRGILTNMDKKEVREVQEMAGKLIEAVSGIGGSMLEAGTWLRGIRTVKSQIEVNERAEKSSVQQVQTAARALNLLGKLMVNILDIIYTSEEKEKVLPLLTTVMYNTVPYLRNHTTTGMSLLQGASRVLASVSEYPYTRRCWKKDGLDLLLDPAFFCMDYESLKSWRTTTDNLMTHDKTTFKDLLTRIAGLGQSNMSIFSSKELEQEQRALLLKRLAFVIFCSDVDQHQKHMPDITDRLSECLRSVPVSPSVLASVFLCFRVLLIRMSAVHVAFLWPVIITEMVVIFCTMENLIEAQINKKKRKGSGSDVTSINNTGTSLGLGLEANDSAAWLSVYLAVCKLLDQVVLLPSGQLPQFQMYKWAFIREGSSTISSEGESVLSTPTEATNASSRNKTSVKGVNNAGKSARNTSSSLPPLQVQDFVPHIARIHKLIQTKIGREVPPCPIPVGEPILTMKSIESLSDLGPWFSALSNSLTRQQTKSLHHISVISRSPLSFLEKIIEQDFLEPYN